MQGIKRIQFIVLAVFSLILGGWGLTAVAQAAGENEVGYSVKAAIPKNQINKKNSFFDLKMKSGQTENLQVRIYNVTNQSIKVQTAIHTAWTSSAGAIEYVKPAKSFDSSLKYKMSDISKLQGKSTVTIPAGKSRVVTAKVKMPTTAFNGVILGGWYFKRIDHQVTGNVKGASNLRNSYSYVVGMKYTMGSQTPFPDLKLGKVAAGLGDYHRGVFADLRNPKAVIIPDLKMKTTITNRNGNKLVKQATKDNVQMAPNTTFRYPIYFGKEELKAGNYHLHMVVKNTDRTWVFDRNFTITAKQAAQFNRGSVENSGINLWLVLALGALGMLVLILLILLIIYLIRRNKKKQDEQEQAES
ncbi:DUF916 and DUF3324 domain-containing protein [Levilactobacillus suantsaiihabitans]|uniref:DUF916 and DUF3324 domain-containing protein n=1 Tax=Levilactobacillus suantsaiihabitans TaxID=2487722 RepID=A0A4Z0JAD4_9LACO|nr:DUF916 and DUF3324 domain-containing protein [Levilactobacillus suantsaiihabitans]TGD19730.1 DUF916 and DUF3324 domain-containing protein [Levilactobacillus suantsaiihabitans]